MGAKNPDYYGFDLPDEPGDYDERHRRLCELVGAANQIEWFRAAYWGEKAICGEKAIGQPSGTGEPVFWPMPSFQSNYPQVYAKLRTVGAEGVVLKRRRSLCAKHMRAGVESRDWLKRRFARD